MKVTKVKLRLIHGKDKLRAIAMIELDHELRINDIRLLETADALVVEFSKTTYQIEHGMEYVCPLTPELSEEITRKVISTYYRKQSSVRRRKTCRKILFQKLNEEKLNVL